MKWQSHRIIGVGAALIFGGGLAGACLSYIGSTLPDVLEGKSPGEGAFFFNSRMNAWKKSHRGSSHWFGWYLLLSLAGYHYSPVFSWIGIGAITHLAADYCTPMGIPIYPFSKKRMITLNLFNTGSFYEYIFSGCLLLFIVYYLARHIHLLHIL